MRIRKGRGAVGADVDMDPRGMPLGTRVWVYLRHSPGDNQTLESQEAAIQRLVKEKKWIIDRIFRDACISGQSVDPRKDFERMIYLAKQKPRPRMPYHGAVGIVLCTQNVTSLFKQFLAIINASLPH